MSDTLLAVLVSEYLHKKIYSEYYQESFTDRSRVLKCFIFHFRVDTRDRSILQADRWSADNVFANRAYFMPDKVPAELGVDHVKESDAGVYRCRVDFRKAQTRNTRVNLTVIGKFTIYHFTIMLVL